MMIRQWVEWSAPFSDKPSWGWVKLVYMYRGVQRTHSQMIVLILQWSIIGSFNLNNWMILKVELNGTIGSYSLPSSKWIVVLLPRYPSSLRDIRYVWRQPIFDSLKISSSRPFEAHFVRHSPGSLRVKFSIGTGPSTDILMFDSFDSFHSWG